MTDITTTNAALPPAPAKMQQRRQQGLSTANNFTSGVQESFPTISFKGSRWSFKFQGQTNPHVDRQGYPVPYLDVVLLDASPNLARVYYAKGYAEGDANPPDCWSIDNVKPDPAAPFKQSPTCGSCKQDVFGSKITPAGKQAKACASSKRVAIALPHDLERGQVGPVMLRVPWTSLGNLKEYTNFLNAHGYDTNGCITRMAFDQKESFPKITFSFHMPLNDLGYEKSLELTASERTKRILSAPADGAVAEPLDEEAAGAVAQAATVVAPTPPPTPAPPVQAPPPAPPPARAPETAPSPLAGALQAAAAPPVPPPPLPQASRNLGGPMGEANVFSLPGLQSMAPPEEPQNDGKPKSARGRNKNAEPANEKKEEKIVDASPGLQNILDSMLPPM